MHRKIRLTESNAKCRHLKKLTSKATLRQVLSEPHTPVLAHAPLYVYTVLLIHTGKRGDLNRKKGKGATVHKAGSTIATFLTESPVYKLL
jgi:hypothetical protein